VRTRADGSFEADAPARRVPARVNAAGFIAVQRDLVIGESSVPAVFKVARRAVPQSVGRAPAMVSAQEASLDVPADAFPDGSQVSLTGLPMKLIGAVPGPAQFVDGAGVPRRVMTSVSVDGTAPQKPVRLRVPVTGEANMDDIELFSANGQGGWGDGVRPDSVQGGFATFTIAGNGQFGVGLDLQRAAGARLGYVVVDGGDSVTDGDLLAMDAEVTTARRGMSLVDPQGTRIDVAPASRVQTEAPAQDSGFPTAASGDSSSGAIARFAGRIKVHAGVARITVAASGTGVRFEVNTPLQVIQLRAGAAITVSIVDCGGNAVETVEVAAGGADCYVQDQKVRTIAAGVVAQVCKGCPSGGVAACGGRDAGAVAIDAAPADAPAGAERPAPDAGPPDNRPPVDVGPDAPAPGGTVARTFVFHEVTALKPGLAFSPVLSADGKTIAFVQNGYQPNHVFVMNADGTNQREVDSYASNCGCQGRVDVSGDGTGVVSTESMQVRYVRSDGSAKKTLVQIDSNEISDFRIAQDGRRVFFVARRDARLVGTQTLIARGVWVINVDGSGLRQVVGIDEVASLYGMTPDKVFPFSGCGVSLDVSGDGNHIVFIANAGGDKAMGVNADGSGLHKIADSGGSALSVHQVHISGDGTKVGYVASGVNNLVELTSAAFDGGGKRVLAASPPTSFGDGCGKPSQMSDDGSRYFMSDVGLLFNTDGTGMAALSFSDFNGDWLVNGALYGGSMSGDASRFVFIVGDQAGQGQAVTMEMGAAPPVGTAPAVTEAGIAPTTIVKDMFGANTIRARITAPGMLRLAIAPFGINGVRDTMIGDPTLVDDGTNGDAVAKDGIYSSNRFNASAMSPAGPRTIRIRAESTTSDGRRHATVVELAGVSVQ
jgi:Tol biopolymer transport system component